nr:uncharacterized protein LOC119177909 [Rhipicephalus microplus]
MSPYVLLLHRQSLFNQLHNLSRPGIRASTCLVTDRYAWPSMQRDCRTWARTCIQCQRAKIARHVTSPLGEFPLPTELFQHVHIDIICHLPPGGPYRYCPTAIDRYTRWPEDWPLVRITAEDIASAFFSGWVSRFGTPRRVTTDQGRQFKEARSRKPDIQTTPAEFVYREPLRLPGALLSAPTSDVTSSDPADFVARLRRTMGALRPSPVAHHTKPTPFVFKDLATCSHAFLRDDTVRAPFQPPYSGPYKVICHDDKTFTLQISGKDVRVSIDRLKPS